MIPTLIDIINVGIIVTVWIAGIFVGWYLRGSKL